MICKLLVCQLFHSLNELELICLYISIAIVSTHLNGFNHCYLTLIYTVKWLQVLLFKTNYFIQHNSFICTQLNA